MRTTLDLNDALLVRAKAEAARQRTTLTRLIEEGLVLRLEQQDAPEEPRRPFRWQVSGDSGVTIDVAEYQRRIAAAEEEWAMRQAGLLPFRDPDDPAE